jgi:flagellar hook assembly protein FlgD
MWSKPHSKIDVFSTPTTSGSSYLTSSNAADITTDTASVAQNGNYPMYKFSTYDLVARTNQTETAKDALSQINVVPNPYYGQSKYEKQRIDNFVKIVNLPLKCTIRIYTINGTLVRTLIKDTDAITSTDWDLKNDKNIPIASGLYIIHIDAGDLGEKTIKWFGVMRPFDLQSY